MNGRNLKTANNTMLITELMREACLNKRPPVFILTAPTASGKTELANALINKYNVSLISLDSMAVYKDMNIGTAKPSSEYLKYYKMINITSPNTDFNVYNFVTMANNEIKNAYKEGKLPALVGGTALYLKGLLEGIFEAPPSNPPLIKKLKEEAAKLGSEYLHSKLTIVDPEAASKIHKNDLKRIVRALEVFELTGKPISQQQTQFGIIRNDINPIACTITWPREVLYKRINKRVKSMIENGLIEEVKFILENYSPLSKSAKQALGYKEVIEYLNNNISYDKMIELIKKRTRNFAKHQLTWFRKFHYLHNIDADENSSINELFDKVDKFLVSKLQQYYGEKL